MLRFIMVFPLFLACLLALAGCAGGAGTVVRSTAEGPTEAVAEGNLVPAVRGLPPTVDHTITMATYRIGPGDLLQVDVFRMPDLTTKGQVGPGGTFVMPLIGPVAVGGLTPEQAGQRIAAALAKDYLQNPQVNVQVLESANMKFTVLGAVKKPGVFNMRGETTLLQAISMAEGIGELAKPEEVVIFRRLPEQPSIQAYVIDFKKVQRGELPDPVLAVNDKVVVPESGVKVFVRNVFGTIRGFISFDPLLN